MDERQGRETTLAQVLDAIEPPDWQADDRAWASRAALSDSGLSAESLHDDPATRDRWLAARSARMVERLRERDSRWPALLEPAHWPMLAGPVLATTGLIGGLLADALAGGDRLNLLSPPFLAVLVWNVVAYVALLVERLRGHAPPVPWPMRMLAGHRAALAASARPNREPATFEAKVTRDFHRLWRSRSAPLLRARALAWLHLAAALFSAGLLAALYWRGLAVEYRAGWSSTFLDAVQVHGLVSVVLGPASLLTGITLPDAPAMSALNFAYGDGENAARWIHLFATTLVIVIVVPRLVLSAWQAARARRLARHFPWPLNDPAVLAVLPARAPSPAAGLAILPFGFAPLADALARLGRAATTAIGPTRVLPAWRLGDEDDASPPALAAGERLVVLFNLAATPELEHHRRLLDTLAAALSAPVQVIIDESGFRARFAGDDTRLAQRHQAWRALLEPAIEPVFVSLDDDDLGDALAERLDAAIRRDTAATTT
ncbi:MAG: DUF2868 domain-containing protein [Burkholderiaceae bacterium]